MKITRDNYESWFLDYLEGHLEEGMVNEFIEFIRQNSDLKDELLLYEPVRLENEMLSYDGKEQLYKELLDLPSEFENAAIARLEGDQTPEEVLFFDDYLSRHPEKKPEADLFNQTKLYPDLSIVFAPKGKIYRQPRVRKMLTWSMRIAAVLLLSWMIYNSAKWSNNDLIPDNSFTEKMDQPRAEDQNNVDNPAAKPEIAINDNQQILSQTNPIAQKTLSDTNKSTRNKQSFKASSNKSGRNISIDGNKEKIAAISGLGEDNGSVIRETVQVPRLISALPGHIMPEQEQMTLAYISQAPANLFQDSSEILSLKDWFLEKTGINDLSFQKILRGGLNLAMNLSNEKFKYKTNREGEIIALNLDTHLLGLSIPVKK